MTFDARWVSIQGTVTSDNRDYCGIAEKNDGSSLYVVVDGSSRGPAGGELASELTSCLIKGFMTASSTVDAGFVIDLLRDAHDALRRRYSADTASYLIVLRTDDHRISVLHAGDCRLGRIRDGETVEWLTRAHTLANAVDDLSDSDLAAHPDRHVLTRSFRAREFQKPDIRTFSLYARDRLVVATDGFWAEMSVQNRVAILSGNSGDQVKTKDDASCLILGTAGGEEVDTSCDANILRRTE